MPPAVAAQSKDEIVNLLCPNATGRTPRSLSNESTQLGGKAVDPWGPSAGGRQRC